MHSAESLDRHFTRPGSRLWLHALQHHLHQMVHSGSSNEGSGDPCHWSTRTHPWADTPGYKDQTAENILPNYVPSVTQPQHFDIASVSEMENDADGTRASTLSGLQVRITQLEKDLEARISYLEKIFLSGPTAKNVIDETKEFPLSDTEHNGPGGLDEQHPGAEQGLVVGTQLHVSNSIHSVDTSCFEFSATLGPARRQVGARWRRSESVTPYTCTMAIAQQPPKIFKM